MIFLLSFNYAKSIATHLKQNSRKFNILGIFKKV